MGSFFLTFRAFSNPIEVGTLLIESYDAADMEGKSRILKVFEKWLEIQPEDFQVLGELWDHFLEEVVMPNEGHEVVKNLQKAARSMPKISPPLLEDSVKIGAQSSPRTARREKLPKSIVPKSKKFTLDELDAVELARQLTLMDYELFQKIRPSEFNNLSWTRKTKDTDAPNLLRMINRFNEVNRFLIYKPKLISC